MKLKPLIGVRIQTYEDAIEAMLSQSVILPPEVLAEIESFIKENKRLGYTTREEFIRDASRWRLKFLKEDFEYVEIPKEKYERLDVAVREMNTPSTAHLILFTDKLMMYWNNMTDGFKKKKSV